jgi:hypothetical protein
MQLVSRHSVQILLNLHRRKKTFAVLKAAGQEKEEWAMAGLMSMYYVMSVHELYGNTNMGKIVIKEKPLKIVVQ